MIIDNIKNIKELNTEPQYAGTNKLSDVK